MAKDELKPIKVFVSYSWTTPEHEVRVLGWAERLRGDGVDVVLDKWDLKEGQDKYVFMEQMVTNSEITKVIVFSDAAYAKKADDRRGGVGTESQIISKEVYEKVDQQKFIPVVCEFTAEGKPCLPVFLGGRIYIDFSSLQQENEEWERLLRAIFDKPLFKKPPLGKPPSHIFDEGATTSRSKSKLLAFRDALLSDKSSFRGLLVDFLEAFLEGLEDYRIDFSKSKREDRELVVQSIDGMIATRDEFLDFTLLLSKYRADQELYEQIADFFESSLRYHWKPEEVNSFKDSWADNYRFFTYELFLYYTTALLKHRRFNQVNALFRRVFIYPPAAEMPRGTTTKFTVFLPEITSLEGSGQDLRLRRPDIPAELLHRRASIKQLPFDALVQTDIILFVASMLYETEGWPWYPKTLAYAHHGQTFELFVRATSQQWFEHIKVLFDVASKEDFAARLKKGIQLHQVGQWQVISRSRTPLEKMLNLERLATTD